MLRALLPVAALVALSATHAYDPQEDIDRLTTVLGDGVTPEILLALQDPALLPADGIHQPLFFWNVSSDTPSGHLAMILPSAVRVGHTVLERAAQGTKFTDSFALRRILNATQMWDGYNGTAEFKAGWEAVDAVVDHATLTGGAPVQFTDPAPLTSFDVSEIAGPVVASGPGGFPGLQCCYDYHMTSVPHGFLCQFEGTSCTMCAECGPGRPPMIPNPTPQPPNPFPPEVARTRLQWTGGAD